MRLKATALLAGTLLAASPVLAIDQAEKWELQLLGAGTSDNEFEQGGFTLTGQLGYYFTDQWQVAVRQSGNYTDSGESSSWSAATRAGAFYHFNYADDQVWVPYLGVNLGYIYGDAVSDTFVAGPELGIRYFVNSTTFISGSIAYEFLFDDADEADDTIDDGQFVYGVAIGFQW